MCGFLVYHSRNNINTGKLVSMNNLMRHRGPDDEGYFLWNSESGRQCQAKGKDTVSELQNLPDSLQESGYNIALAHRRLSIIDVSSRAHQPMSSDDQKIWITYNGELYNFKEIRSELESTGYRFRTSSDTEVIIYAYKEWGTDCLKKFNGIYGFALLDTEKKTVFVARDHLGIKPVYFYHDNEEFVASSELKPILQIAKPDIDLTALDKLLTFRYVPSPLTMINKVRKLPPGHFVVFDGKKIDIKRYWCKVPRIRLASPDQLSEKIEAAIKRQLMSDVPLGVLLSGGMDSAGVVAVMHSLGVSDIRTFTIGFEGQGSQNEFIDARKTANIFGCSHNETTVSAKDYQEFFPKYVEYLEEPICNPSAIAWYFVSKLARSQVKVVLTGQGTDELFAGYDRYIGERYHSIVAPFLKAGLHKIGQKVLTKNDKLRRAMMSLSDNNTYERFIKIYSVFSETDKKELYKFSVPDTNNDCWSHHALLEEIESLDSLSQMMYLDTRFWLPDDLLTVADKLSMAVSLEARVPYLDVELVQFSETIASSQKLRGLTLKHILKKSLGKWLNKEIITRKKKGFINPVAKWLRESLSSFVKELVLQHNSVCENYFDLDFIKRLLKEHESGSIQNERQILQLLTFELWHRRFIKTQY